MLDVDDGFDSGNDDPSSASSGLIHGLRVYDADQWRRMATIYAPLVYRWCLKAGVRADDAHDIVQEVFRTIVMRVGEFCRDRPGQTFRGWLWTITRHKLGDFFRSRSGQPPAIGGSKFLERLQSVTGGDEPASSGHVDGLAQACHRALLLIEADFEPHTWQAFWRVAVEGQYPADVAADLKISVNAVYLAKSRILRRLRDELELQGQDSREQSREGPAI